MSSIVQKVLNPTYVPEPLLFVTSIVQKVFKTHLCSRTFVTSIVQKVLNPTYVLEPL